MEMTMSRFGSRAAGACHKSHRTMVVIGTMLLAACGSEAKQAPSHEIAHPPFSVADVRLGMTPAEVENALRAKGFDLTVSKTRDAFANEVAEARYIATHVIPTGHHDYGEAITSIHGKKGDELIDVGLTDLENGPIVSDATYHAPVGAGSFAATKADLITRYGKSEDQNSGVKTSWCPTSTGNYCDLDKPSLRLLGTGGGIEIRLPRRQRRATTARHGDEEGSSGRRRQAFLVLIVLRTVFRRLDSHRCSRKTAEKPLTKLLDEIFILKRHHGVHDPLRLHRRKRRAARLVR